MRCSSVHSGAGRTETLAARRMRRLAAFPQPYRKFIAGLSSCAPAIEDLCDTFPALLFAMATGFGGVRQRQAAFDAVVAGQPLKAAAAVLGLPLWLRRIPPEAFAQPLPVLPADEEFVSVALNRLPSAPQDAAVWFDRMLVGYRLVGRDFALWMMSEPRLLPPESDDQEMQWLLAWAWASRHPEFAGHELLRQPWSPDIGWRRARDEVLVWRKRIDLVGALAGPPRSPWLRDANVSGYTIVALRSVHDFIAESRAMDNCLDQYAAHLAYGRIRIFSIRKNGQSLADVEISLRQDDPAKPCVSQIRGPRNRRAPPIVWQVVQSWLSAQPFAPADVDPTSPQLTREAFRMFWAPYVSVAEAAGLPPSILARVLGRDARRGLRTDAGDRPANADAALRRLIEPAPRQLRVAVIPEPEYPQRPLSGRRLGAGR